MKFNLFSLSLLALLLTGSLVLTGCNSTTTTEDAGTGDAVEAPVTEEATEAPAGTLEEAGAEADEALEEAGEKTDEAMKKTGEAVEEAGDAAHDTAHDAAADHHG